MSEIEIQFTYMTSSGELRDFRLSPEEYFDPLEPGETYEREGCARFFTIHEYLPLPPSQLSWAEVSIRGTEHDRTFTVHFYGKDHEWLSNSYFAPDGEELMILTVNMAHGPLTIRLRKWSQHDQWAVENITRYAPQTEDIAEDIEIRKMVL